MYTAISVVFVHCCLLVSSLHHNGLDQRLDLLAKTAKKHQHSLHGVELLRTGSDCEPEPEYCSKACV